MLGTTGEAPALVSFAERIDFRSVPAGERTSADRGWDNGYLGDRGDCIGVPCRGSGS